MVFFVALCSLQLSTEILSKETLKKILVVLKDIHLINQTRPQIEHQIKFGKHYCTRLSNGVLVLHHLAGMSIVKGSFKASMNKRND